MYHIVISGKNFKQYTDLNHNIVIYSNTILVISGSTVVAVFYAVTICWPLSPVSPPHIISRLVSFYI